MKYYLVNTNKKADPDGRDEKTMLDENIVALYFEHYKQRIKKLNEGDIVFLYSNGTGIIAFGEVVGKTQIRAYRPLPKFEDDEYYRNLKNFKKISQPVTVKMIMDKVGKKLPVYKAISEINESYAQCVFELVEAANLSIAS